MNLIIRLGIQFSANFINLNLRKKYEKQRGHKKLFCAVISDVIVNDTALHTKNKTVKDDFTEIVLTLFCIVFLLKTSGQKISGRDEL